MADTGAPWNIPYIEPSDIVRDYPAADEAQALAIAAALSGAGFNASTTITATNASFAVPSLGGPIVKVTVVGGGGGGGLSDVTTNGGTGGSTTFGSGAAYEVVAAGGLGGKGGTNTGTPRNGTAGLASGNGGQASTNAQVHAESGGGGAVKVAYIDLTGVTTVNVVIGAGGTAAGGTAGAGGRGEVILEYSAAA